MKTFSTYHEWRAAITGPCGLTLDRNYCEQRIAALHDLKFDGTQPFVSAYSTKYRDQIVEWFRQALNEA